MELLNNKVEALKKALAEVKVLSRDLEKHGLTLAVRPSLSKPKAKVASKPKAKPVVKKEEPRKDTSKKAPVKKGAACNEDF